MRTFMLLRKVCSETCGARSGLPKHFIDQLNPTPRPYEDFMMDSHTRWYEESYGIRLVGLDSNMSRREVSCAFVDR